MILKGDNMRVVISGGGTGGHIYPAVAIIEELKRRDENIEILYIGSKNSMESELIPSLNLLRLWGFQEKLIRNFLNQFLFYLKDYLKQKKY